mmetsp:Transcript_35539/g.65777  ORF Transcript_35539/g.65777 Transcript_35539/m.65777 type:complete len:209 (+) Transcript_35539:1363-1989(+)
MEFLISGHDSVEDFDGLVNGGLVDHDRLESPFKRPVTFDVLTILRYCRGANDSNLTPCQSGLQQIGSVHATIATASSSTNQGMQLVDKQNRRGRRRLFNQRLDAFLEIPTKLHPCNETCQVNGNHTESLQRSGTGRQRWERIYLLLTHACRRRGIFVVLLLFAEWIPQSPSTAALSICTLVIKHEVSPSKALCHPLGNGSLTHSRFTD